jgi:hypothetical protein
MIENISINIKPIQTNQYKISIIGSLSKFLHGNNLVRLTRVDVKKAVHELSRLSGLDMSEAKVKAIDIAANIILDHPVQCYNVLLSEKLRSVKSVIKDYQTVRFETGNRSLSFYDKKKEFLYRNRRETKYRRQFSSLLNDKYWIRYELKLKKSLESVSGSSMLKLKDIYHPIVYRRLILCWYKNYHSVQKEIEPGYQTFENFSGYLISQGINAIGGIGKTSNLLDAWIQHHRH